MKKLICILVSMVFICQACFCAYGKDNRTDAKDMFSEMSEEECLSFIQEQGVIIPDEYKDYEKLGELVKDITEYVEENPKDEYRYNYTALDDFYVEIRKAVLKYKNIDAESKSMEIVDPFSVNSSGKLLYSTALYNWNESFNNQNCYGYAIGIYSRIDPGEYCDVQLTGTSLLSMTLDRLACIVQWDLSALGYKDVRYGRERPAHTAGYRVLALKKSSSYNDYHFMVEYSPSVWRHKPGTSIPLQYNYSVPTEGKWTNEGAGRDYAHGQVTGGNIVYDSEVIYIRYKEK